MNLTITRATEDKPVSKERANKNWRSMNKLAQEQNSPLMQRYAKMVVAVMMATLHSFKARYSLGKEE